MRQPKVGHKKLWRQIFSVIHEQFEPQLLYMYIQGDTYFIISNKH